MTPKERLASAGEPRHNTETYSPAFAKGQNCFSARADCNRGEWIRGINQDGCVTEQELRKRLEVVRSEHRDLDAAIHALTQSGSTDQLQIARLKKRKLRIRDQIADLEDNLLPDIIA